MSEQLFWLRQGSQYAAIIIIINNIIVTNFIMLLYFLSARMAHPGALLPL